MSEDAGAHYLFQLEGIEVGQWGIENFIEPALLAKVLRHVDMGDESTCMTFPASGGRTWTVRQRPKTPQPPQPEQP
jgi:hypothetical protein